MVPASLMGRLIVRLQHAGLTVKAMWRTGVLLAHDTQEGEIELQDCSVSVRVISYEGEGQLMQVLAEQVGGLLKSLFNRQVVISMLQNFQISCCRSERLPLQQMVSCPHCLREGR